jgi:hypothetical protein
MVQKSKSVESEKSIKSVILTKMAGKVDSCAPRRYKSTNLTNLTNQTIIVTDRCEPRLAVCNCYTVISKCIIQVKEKEKKESLIT